METASEQRIHITEDTPHNGKSLKHEYMISQDEVDVGYNKSPELYRTSEYSELFTVSDNKLVLIQII
ncbi:6413_t:CDS:2, partial [Racocetra persica]